MGTTRMMKVVVEGTTLFASCVWSVHASADLNFGHPHTHVHTHILERRGSPTK